MVILDQPDYINDVKGKVLLAIEDGKNKTMVYYLLKILGQTPLYRI